MVGVLLEAAGVAQVRAQRALVRALFTLPVELRQEHDGHV